MPLRKKSSFVVQVPVDRDFLSRIDETAGYVGENRAEFLREACRQRLRWLEEEAEEQRYVEGYRKKPESDTWGRSAAKALAASVADEKWE